MRKQRIGTLLGSVGFLAELLGIEESKFMEVKTVKQLVLMLKKDRLDAVVFEKVSIKTSAENLHVEDFYDKEAFLIPISFAVRMTAKGDELKKS